jgi:hypothetical protein
MSFLRLALAATLFATSIAVCYADCSLLKSVHTKVGCCDDSFTPNNAALDSSALKSQMRAFEDNAFGVISPKMPQLVAENLAFTVNRYFYLWPSKYITITEGHKRINTPKLPTQVEIYARDDGDAILADSGTFLAKNMTLRGTEYAAGFRIYTQEYRGQVADYIYEEQRAGYINSQDGSNFTIVALNAQGDLKTFDDKDMFIHASSVNVDRAALMDDTGTCHPAYADYSTLCANENPFDFASRKVPVPFPWFVIVDYAIDDTSPIHEFNELKNSFCLHKYAPLDGDSYVAYLMSLAPGYAGGAVDPYADLWKIESDCYKFQTESKADFPVRVGEWFGRRP